MIAAHGTYLTEWMNFYSRLNEDYHHAQEELLREEMEFILEAGFKEKAAETGQKVATATKEAATTAATATASAAGSAAKGTVKAAAGAVNTVGNGVKNAAGNAAKGKLKAFWDGLLKKIKELWARFLNTIDSLVKSDASWLKKYKSSILNADLSKFEYEIFPYWQGSSVLSATKIPAFAENNPQFIEDLKSEDEFRAKYFPAIKDIAGTESFVEELKHAFRGGDSITLKSNSFKSRLAGMIDYCEKYADIKRIAARDYANIEKAVVGATRKAVTAQQEMAREAIRSGTASTDLTMTLESFILEADTMADVNAARKKQEEERKARIGQENNRFKDNVDRSTQDVDKKDATGGMDNSSQDKAQENLDAIRRYVVMCQKVLGAKMSIYEERYREYMKLLRKIAPMTKTAGEGSYKGEIKKLQIDKAQLEQLDAEQKKEVQELIEKREEQVGFFRKMISTLSLAQKTKDPKVIKLQSKIQKLDERIDSFFQGG